MKRNYAYILTILCTVALLSSCTIEKRVYNKGYHTMSAKKEAQKSSEIAKKNALQDETSMATTENTVVNENILSKKNDEIILKNNQVIEGKVVSTNAKKTTFTQNGATKTIKNKDVSLIKQVNAEVLIPQNSAKMEQKSMKKAIDKETFLPNLLAIIFGGAAFLIFLWIAVALYFNPVASLIFALITIGLGIAAIIFGIKGLKAGGRFKWMGIVGLATGAAASLIALIILILDIVHIARGWKGGIGYIY